MLEEGKSDPITASLSPTVFWLAEMEKENFRSECDPRSTIRNFTTHTQPDDGGATEKKAQFISEYFVTLLIKRTASLYGTATVHAARQKKNHLTRTTIIKWKTTKTHVEHSRIHLNAGAQKNHMDSYSKCKLCVSFTFALWVSAFVVCCCCCYSCCCCSYCSLMVFFCSEAKIINVWRARHKHEITLDYYVGHHKARQYHKYTQTYYEIWSVCTTKSEAQKNSDNYERTRSLVE